MNSTYIQTTKQLPQMTLAESLRTMQESFRTMQEIVSAPFLQLQSMQETLRIAFGYSETWQETTNDETGITAVSRGTEIIVAHSVDLEGIRAVVREELHRHEEQVLQYRTIDTDIEMLSTVPPLPHEKGWEFVFDWFYRVPRWYCRDLGELARKIGYTHKYTSEKHVQYRAENGERPLPQEPERIRFSSVNNRILSLPTGAQSGYTGHRR